MTNKGNLIAELRREAGFTQKTLAEELHITDKAVSKWERGLSMPDVSLLPKLSLLLNADMSLLLAPEGKQPHEGWKGLIDLRESRVDPRRKVYDKPAVYYLLIHYLLLDIREICFLCSEEDRKYLESDVFVQLGFKFSFELPGEADANLMIMHRPAFIFGSDLTHHFQRAMFSGEIIKLEPVNFDLPFLFCPSEYTPIYLKNPQYLFGNAVPRTLGRGMICSDMDSDDAVFEIASFVRTYQMSTRLLIGSLEEVAFKKGIIDREALYRLAEDKPYGDLLRKMTEK